MGKVYDSFSDMTEGMDSGSYSPTITPRQYAKGVNVTCRGGKISSRPPFNEIGIPATETAIRFGKFQGMKYYKADGKGYIAFAFQGKIYLMDPIGGAIFDMTADAAVSMNEYVDRMYFQQVEQTMVVQDGSSTPLLLLGTSARVSVLASSEVPIGTLMAYGQGRLFVKVGDGFLAGDIVKPNDPGAVLKFTETDYLAGGGSFSLPANVGEITGMQFVQYFGTGTGLGPLIVGAEQGMQSFDVSTMRSQWQDVGISRIEAGEDGVASQYSMVRMNEDLLYMSWSGLQDFALLNMEAARQHRMTNMNYEVKAFTDLETKAYRALVAAARFDDRCLYTVVGEKVTALDANGASVDDYRFGGLIALDYSPVNGISTIGQHIKPAYDGVWTGVHPMGIASGIFDLEERCFVFGKDDDGINHLYEVGTEMGKDNGAVSIVSRVYTRGFYFIDYASETPHAVPHFEKKLLSAHVWLGDLDGDVEVKLFVRPDHSGGFDEISSVTVHAPTTGDALTQTRAKLRFPAFDTSKCKNVSGKNALLGFTVEMMIELTGQGSIARFSVEAEGGKEMPSVSIDDPVDGVVEAGVLLDDFSYEIVALDTGETAGDSGFGATFGNVVNTFAGTLTDSAVPLFTTPETLTKEGTRLFWLATQSGAYEWGMSLDFVSDRWQLKVYRQGGLMLLIAEKGDPTTPYGVYNVVFQSGDSDFTITVTTFTITAA